jgi:hypothetical protein
VLEGDHRVTDAQPLAPGEVDEAAGALAGRVLERAPRGLDLRLPLACVVDRGHGGRDALGRRGRQAQARAREHGAWRQLAVAVAQAERVGRQAHDVASDHHLDLDERVRQAPEARTGVHHDGPAELRRHAEQALEPRQPGALRAPHQAGQRRRRAEPHVCAAVEGRQGRVRRAEADDPLGDPGVAHQEVRAGAQHEERLGGGLAQPGLVAAVQSSASPPTLSVVSPPRRTRVCALAAPFTCRVRPAARLPRAPRRRARRRLRRA